MQLWTTFLLSYHDYQSGNLVGESCGKLNYITHFTPHLCGKLAITMFVAVKLTDLFTQFISTCDQALIDLSLTGSSFN